MLGEQNGYCLHLGDGQWVRPPSFSAAEHSKAQRPWSQLEEMHVGLRAMGVPSTRELGRRRDLAVLGGAGSSSSGNLDAEVNVCPDEGC